MRTSNADVDERRLAKLMLLTAMAAMANVTWTQIPSMDNYGYDIKTASSCAGNATCLQTACLSERYCAGFSQKFNILKFNVSAATLGHEANNVLWVRHPVPPSIPQPPPIPIWPLPKRSTFGAGEIAVHKAAFTGFALAPGSATSALLSQSMERVHAALFPSRLGITSVPKSALTATTLTKCTVSIASGDESLQLGVNESYSMHIRALPVPHCSIEAPAVWGALHALQTFSMMLEFDRETQRTSVGTIRGLPLSIDDEPRFEHRGLMLDTARHFVPVSIIKTHLEAMSASKINVLHWHLSDMQSFCTCSPPCSPPSSPPG